MAGGPLRIDAFLGGPAAVKELINLFLNIEFRRCIDGPEASIKTEGTGLRADKFCARGGLRCRAGVRASLADPPVDNWVGLKLNSISLINAPGLVLKLSPGGSYILIFAWTMPRLHSRSFQMGSPPTLKS